MDRQTDNNNFIGHCPSEVERPMKLKMKYKIILRS